MVKLNIHKTCKEYVPENDMCLRYFQLGYFEVGKNYPDECVDHIAFDEHGGCDL